jgi:small subunit ribosomal protein S14
MGGKAQLIRDMRKRISADQFEVQRRAFLYVARNTALPNTVRHKAQLGLNALNGGEGRMGAVKNRCVETGRGRGAYPCQWNARETADEQVSCRNSAFGEYVLTIYFS